LVLFIDFSVLVCNFAEAKRRGDYSAGSVVDSAKELREETYSGKSRGQPPNSGYNMRLNIVNIILLSLTSAASCQSHWPFVQGWKIERLSEPRQRFFRLVFAIATDDV